MMKILTVVGARPQFIKAAVINRAIRKHNENNANKIEEVIVHTGQHYDPNMSDIFFAELAMVKPKYNLRIGEKIQTKSTPATQIAAMLVGLEEIFQAENPDLVLLYGDTNSTLAGALMAAKMRIPIAHIEAGVRNYDMHNVEEQNRIVTDHMSRYLFCPTNLAVACLQKEGIIQGLMKNDLMIHVSNPGDVMYDAYLFEYEKCRDFGFLLDRYKVEKAKYILLTIHRDENAKPEKLKKIFSGLAEIKEKIIFPIHPRTKKVVEQNDIYLSDNIHCLEPLGYREMLFMQKNARVIITDSGGVQKEAYFSRVPCITIMEKTGWPETVETGWNHLIGSEYDFVKYLDAQRAHDLYDSNLFGDGKAGEKIVSTLANIETNKES